MAAVVVAGGGLAGLVVARRLAEAGVDVRLFERREEVGGRVRTLRTDGFVLDRGFQVLLEAYPAVRRELDLEALDLRPFRPGAIVARRGRRSVLADPFRDPAAVTAALFSRAVTVGDKLRLLRLRRRIVGTEPDELLEAPDTSIRDGLEEAGFSDRFVDDVATPLYGGITLDRSLSTSMRVFEYTFKMLAEGRATVPATGMAAIPQQLAERAEDAGATVETGATVRRVDAAGDAAVVAVGGEEVTADVAVVATDPPTARELTGVGAIPTEGRGCVTQYYSLPAEEELRLERRLLVNAEPRGPNHVVAHSELAPGHAPVGQSLVSATFLGRPDAPPEALAEETREALAAWFPERRFDALETVHTERVPFAQFAQPPGFRESLPDATAPDGPVFLAGDYTRWSSIQGALESGRAAALAVLSALEGR